jgi:hypothetical protein
MIAEVFTTLIGAGVGHQAKLAQLALEMEPHGVAFATALDQLVGDWQVVERGNSPRDPLPPLTRLDAVAP